jgi:hypothetical protein
MDQLKPSYQPVSTRDEASAADDSINLNGDDSFVDSAVTSSPLRPQHDYGESDIRPLNIDDAKTDDGEDESFQYLFQWQDPSLPFVVISILLTTPIVLGNILLFYELTGVWFLSLPFLCHLLAVLLTSKRYISYEWSIQSTRCSRAFTSFVSLIDIGLLCVAYPVVWTFFIDELFTEVDGTTSVDWANYKRRLLLYRRLAYVTGTSRCLVGLYAFYLRIVKSYIDAMFDQQHSRLLLLWVLVPFTFIDQRLQLALRYCCFVSYIKANNIRKLLQRFVSIVILFLMLLFVVSLSNAILHFGTSSCAMDRPSDCDPLDDTECWLPFPSFHALRKDTTTCTGWRVHLQGHLLPPLKNLKLIQPNFLNRLDGFSTMAPMLFYLPGLKEAHEAGIGQLMGSDSIAKSVTEGSATLLIDVETKTLVFHTAEIDYLDGNDPVVMIFPAQPLHHNRHYAIAIINALDAFGTRLPRTAGMNALLLDFEPPKSLLSLYDTERQSRYQDQVIPTLESAAPWFNFTADPQSLQLLFDFHTISEESQLGPVRGVRDSTIGYISSMDWNWSHHVRTNRIMDYHCDDTHNSILARTVHAEIDVPWFLKQNGVLGGPRASVLDWTNDTANDQSYQLGVAKFILQIPCSIKAAAVGNETTAFIRPLRAVMEYGHGLFGNRGEASDDYLLRIAHNEGYVILAMDWRGMSTYDLLLVVKVLISTPHLFESVRDNLIQGYASKYSLQHFARNGLLSMDWLSFPSRDGSPSKPVPLLNNNTPAHVFYGISQGGILGSGYTALSGTTGLIDRSILGSGGTPFALIMTRSRDFFAYDKLLLLNFYCNRHVRMLLTLVQMAWDSVEASGVLAPPVNEPYPRVLIQAGLGDVIVSTTATEALCRAFNASTVPGNPRHVFGLPTEPVLQDASDGPHAVLTEIMYDNEYHNMPVQNIFGNANAIHICLRRDRALIKQLTEFINNGRVIDPCTNNSCHRLSVMC